MKNLKIKDAVEIRIRRLSIPISTVVRSEKNLTV